MSTKSAGARSSSRASSRPSASRTALAPAPEERIGATLDSFRRVIRALRLAARRAEDASGLRPAQLFVLRHVAAAPDQSLSELATRTLTDRTSVADMIDRLAQRGLVRRVRGARDARRVEVRLTAAGTRALAKAPASPTDLLLAGLGQLDAAELDRLAHGVAALERAMGVAGEPATMLFEDAPPAAPGAPAARVARRPQSA